MDRVSATETVDLGSISGRVKLKIIKIGIHSFHAWRSAMKWQCEASSVCGRQVGTEQVEAWLEDWKVLSLSSGQGNLVNKLFSQTTF